MIHIICPPFVEGNNLRYLTNAVIKDMNDLGLEHSVINYISGEQPRSTTSGFYNMDEWMRIDMRSGRELINFIFNGDYVFYVDFWSPSVLQLKMHCILNRLDVKFIGWYHGSSTLQGDYLSHFSEYDKYKISGIELAMFKCFDKIWCASDFFISGIPDEYDKHKVLKTGEPFSTSDYFKFRNTKNKLWDVVVPFRMDPDKVDIADLKFIVASNQDLKFLITSPIMGSYMGSFPNVTIKIGANDFEHIKDLADSKVVLSTAIQEGWGYAIMKAITVGCIPVLPNRAVYKELYDMEYLYDTSGYANTLIRMYVKSYPVKAFVPNDFSMQDAIQKTFMEVE